MKDYESTEIAYKNGYAKGKKDAVKHGTWGAAEIVGYDGIRPVYAIPCSRCGKYTREYLKPFCPNCGAKMDLEGE